MRRVTSDWSLDLDDSFEGRVVDENLQFVSAGPPVRTVLVAVWTPPESDSPWEVLEWIRRDVHPDPVERFESGGPGDEEVAYASWYPETVDGREQWGLYAYTVRRGSYVQLACLCDEPDLDWALGVWRSLTFHSEAE